MGLKQNETIIILLIGIGVVCVLAAAFLFRLWNFYINNTKNKDIYLRRIRSKRNTAATTQPETDLEANPEAGGTV